MPSPLPWNASPAASYNESTPKRSSKKPEDINVLAAAIIEEATGSKEAERHKNPHAVALGRLGGKKGGLARAKKLTPEQRQEIARRAARARWRKRP